MSILLSLKNLNLEYGKKTIFNDAELTIQKGDQIGLIGLNGQGKSTLFNILNEKVIPDTSTPPFLYDRSNDPFEIFLVPQELNISDFRHLNIENYYLAFYPELHELHLELEKDYSNQELFSKFESMGGWDIQNSYINYLKGFDLKDTTRSIENLSGGEKRKMALSVGLSSNAEFILWDEPTNHLDIETIERFEDELMNSNKTYMIISHDRYLLNHTTKMICHIERGKINQFRGTYLDYLEYLNEKEAELKKNLDKLENAHRRELAWMRQGIKARGTRSKKRVERFHNISDKIDDLKKGKRKNIELDLQHSGRKSKVLTQIEEGKFSYDDKEIFNSLNLMITKKDKIALMGPNGSGKSTLINILREKLTLGSGKQKNAQDLKIVVFDQNRESLNLSQTPFEALSDGSDFVTLANGTQRHINSYLQSFLFDSNQVYRPISTLSGGEKNRLQLALFMRQSADLWVFDEPTNDLDIETLELLERELKSYDSAVIIISHDRAFLDNICQTTWLINGQTVEIFEGGYTQVAPYLHALEQVKQVEDSTPQIKTEEKPKEKKLSNKQKKRMETIENDIEKAELELEEANKNLSSFTFDSMDSKKRVEFEELTRHRDQCEKKIKTLYEEWEELSSY